ncbi:MAG: hypothetical protein ABJA66_16005 [Actinomycetota bacterium]
MNYTKENEDQMGGAQKTVRFNKELSEQQKAALITNQSTITGLDTLDGLTIFPSIEDSAILYWGDDSIEKQIRDIIENSSMNELMVSL